MNLKQIYKKVIEKGIEADIRPKSEIKKILSRQEKKFRKMPKEKKKYFDEDTLFNPFADTRIVFAKGEGKINAAVVGIDIGAGELLLAERLNQKGAKINLAISHHPQGYAAAKFYEVMDLQIDGFAGYGVSLSLSEKLLQQRKNQVARGVHAANFSRSYDIAKFLKLNFFCMHTPCDNLAYQFLKGKIAKAKPSSLEDVIDILYGIGEYQEAAKFNDYPKIAIGSKQSRCRKIHIEFTGGTGGPEDIYQQLAARGVDTIVSMHQSEANYKKCKQANINLILASHIASDNIGVNFMLDWLQAEKNFKIYELGGFRRIRRKK